MVADAKLDPNKANLGDLMAAYPELTPMLLRTMRDSDYITRSTFIRAYFK
jgi:hypothetical protein